MLCMNSYLLKLKIIERTCKWVILVHVNEVLNLIPFCSWTDSPVLFLLGSSMIRVFKFKLRLSFLFCFIYNSWYISFQFNK